jgi:peptidoglycan/xylan/chitin deacetylase (PgdA/CDA1 family)
MLKLAAVAAGVFVFAVPPRFRDTEVTRLPTHAKVVALTLDCGGSPGGGWTDVATLRRAHATATFFLTGRFVRRNPRLARAIAKQFPVGNHTETHTPMTTLSDSAAAAEITQAEQDIRRVTGADPRPLFRFPYGDSDERTIRIANRLGYVAVRWTVDTLGWMPGQTVAQAVQRVVAGVGAGEIVLMHVGQDVDTRALPAVIAALRARGYRFTTLDALR